MGNRKFTWDCLSIDSLYHNYYVVSKYVCEEKSAVIGYIVDMDNLSNTDVEINSKAEIKDGWSRYTVCNYDGENIHGYIAEIGEEKPNYGNGWFPVWIVNQDDICIF